jgi:hypothetical protein
MRHRSDGNNQAIMPLRSAGVSIGSDVGQRFFSTETYVIPGNLQDAVTRQSADSRSACIRGHGAEMRDIHQLIFAEGMAKQGKIGESQNNGRLHISKRHSRIFRMDSSRLDSRHETPSGAKKYLSGF